MRWAQNRTRPRIAVVAALAAFVTGTLPAGPAWSAGPNQPFYGDLDRDGYVDRITLVPLAANGCPVRVERGRAGGSYLPPRTYHYPEPGRAGAGGCADMGVAVDLGGDGQVELVLTWFAGRPPGVNTDLIVLRNFTPAGGFSAIFQPSYMGLADFNGDRRLDVYQWTDQGEGFRSFLNTANSQLVPGPVRWCFYNLPDVEIADFQRNGRADVAIAYSQGCDGMSSGVVVVLDDGRPVLLEREPDGLETWSITVGDYNGDRIPDVRTTNEVTNVITTYLSRGDGTFVRSPLAVADRAYIRGYEPIRIRVLDNDAATTDARVVLIQAPMYGSARVAADRTIIYTPRPGSGATADRLVYRLLQEGKQSTTSVSLRFLPVN